MLHDNIQNIMRMHYIIVTGAPGHKFEFDDATFSSLNLGESLNRIVTIHSE